MVKVKDVNDPKIVAPAGNGIADAVDGVQLLAVSVMTDPSTAWIAPKVPFLMAVSVTYSAPPCPRDKLVSFAIPSML